MFIIRHTGLSVDKTSTHINRTHSDPALPELGKPKPAAAAADKSAVEAGTSATGQDQATAAGTEASGKAQPRERQSVANVPSYVRGVPVTLGPRAMAAVGK